MTSGAPNSASRWDAIVVGAGPAGIAAAITAHSTGKSVLVIDKARFPRDKCCGDGLTTGALRLLERLGVDRNDVGSWRECRDVEVRSPSGRVVSMQLPDDGAFAAIATRLDLDNALVTHARRNGIEVREGVAYESLAIDGDDVLVTVRTATPADSGSDGTESVAVLRCGHVIAADGMWSPVRKSIDAGDDAYRGEWHAIRQYARHVTGPASSRLYVWFEPDLLPGYVWSFPLPDGRVNLGFGILRGSARRPGEMRTLWEGILRRPHVRAALGDSVEMEDRFLAWPIPARVSRTTLTRTRVMFVGDAARATDVLTGEGIGQALASGILAGAALSHSHPERSYRRAMRREFFADDRMSRILGALLRSERTTRAALRIVDATDWTRRNFVRWMFEDEPRAAAFTPRRWHRRFLARPGAWRAAPTPGP
ncbi:MAG: NAD(P)/FAD-dependent oxidoreductase [Ilumatobacteraceae bacterium]